MNKYQEDSYNQSDNIISYSEKLAPHSISGIMQQNNDIHLPREIFLKILCLENKIEKKSTLQSLDNLILLYSQLVEHYNMKRDPIYIYFLERIKNYLTKTNSLKLYFQAELDIHSNNHHNNNKNNISKDEVDMDDSIFLSDEERERSPHKIIRESSQQQLQNGQQSLSFLKRGDSFENLIEQKRQQLRKSISFINYQQAKKSQLQEEIYDLERKRNERSLKLSVFKEIFLNQDVKKNEVKQIIENYEEQSKQKDTIVKSDIDQQMTSIQQRIQIKRDNQFKKSLTIELNTPRSHREETNNKISQLPSSTKNAKSQNEFDNEMSPPYMKSANVISFQSQDYPNSKSSNKQNSYDKTQPKLFVTHFSSNKDDNDNSQQQQQYNQKSYQQVQFQSPQSSQQNNKNKSLRINNFHEKLGIIKTVYEEELTNQNNNNNQNGQQQQQQRIKKLGSLQDESPYSSDDNQGQDYNNNNNNNNNNYQNGNQQQQQQSYDQSPQEYIQYENQNQINNNNNYKQEQSLIREIVSQEHSFSQKESISPSKYMKDFGYDNDYENENNHDDNNNDHHDN